MPAYDSKGGLALYIHIHIKKYIRGKFILCYNLLALWTHHFSSCTLNERKIHFIRILRAYIIASFSLNSLLAIHMLHSRNYLPKSLNAEDIMGLQEKVHIVVCLHFFFDFFIFPSITIVDSLMVPLRIPTKNAESPQNVSQSDVSSVL